MNVGAVPGPPLPTSAFRAFYGVYRELGKVGVSVPEAKRMEVWEVAAQLGVGARDAVPGPSGEDPRALLRQRLAASRGEAPVPVAAATSAEEIAAMMGALTTPSK